MADLLPDVLPDEPAVLRHLIGLMMAPTPEVQRFRAMLAPVVPGSPPSALPSALPAPVLSPAERLALRAPFFLLAPEEPGSGAPDVDTFASFTLARLLRQLNYETERRPVERPASVRGAVHWPATVRARYGQVYDPARYVCREVHRVYDTPENQLLKYVVEAVDACLRAVPAVVWSGACVDPSGGTAAAGARLQRIEAALAAFRRSVRLRHVTRPDVVTEAHLVRAESTRMPEYATAVRLYRRHESVVAAASWGGVVRAAKAVLPLPGAAGPEGSEAGRWLAFCAALLPAGPAS